MSQLIRVGNRFLNAEAVCWAELTEEERPDGTRRQVLTVATLAGRVTFRVPAEVEALTEMLDGYAAREALYAAVDQEVLDREGPGRVRVAPGTDAVAGDVPG